MKPFRWDHNKNETLKSGRNISFEEFELDFLRAARPEREVQCFESLAAQLLEYKRDHPYVSQTNITNEYLRLLIEGFKVSP